MSIPVEDIARVREITDTVALIGETTQLRRVGTRWVGLCPFHTEKTPSFSVNASEGLWHCFGCGAGGDVITFVQETSRLEFADAVEVLAGRVGLRVRRDESDGSRARRQHRDRLHDVMATAAAWYHERLVDTEEAAEARRYLRSRGYDADTVRRFSLGWAPTRRCDLASQLGAPEDLLIEAGLLRRRSQGGTIPLLRGRVMFPIYDAAGLAVAFSGRVLPGADGPKYLNTPESPLYAKRQVLYGLNWAKEEIVRAGVAVVCEGQTDVIGMHQAGIPLAIAPCGTALTGDQVALLRRFAERLVLCFDGDGAGLDASERLYGREASHRVSIAVAGLPAGVDPGDLARTDPLVLRAAVEGAVPLLAFRLRRLLDESDLDTPDGRAAAARTAAVLVAEHSDPLVRGSYLEDVARRCQLSSAQLAGLAQRGSGAPASDPSPLADDPETEMLRVAVHHPEAVPSWVEAAYFADPVLRAAFGFLATSATLHEAISRAESEESTAAIAIRRAAVEQTQADPAEVSGRLVGRAANRALRELVEGAGRGADANRVAREVAAVRTATDRLRFTSSWREAAEYLASWLAGGGGSQSGRDVPTTRHGGTDDRHA